MSDLPGWIMPRYRLLALDIDGTVVDSRHELSPQTRDAILAAQAAGIHVVLATGRRYGRTLPLVEPLGIKVPLITASGALIKDPSDHRTLFCATFTPELARGIVRHIAADQYEPIMYGDTFHQGFDYYCRTHEVACPLLQEFFSLNLDSRCLWPRLLDDPPVDLFAGFAMGTQSQMEQLMRDLGEAFPEQLDSHVLRSPRYAGYMCELAPAGVSKWTGVWHLAQQLGIEPDEICAAGDDVNDLPMIAAAGLGVAMANAIPQVRAAADRIAPSNDEHGVVEIVRWLLE